jgi:hypothetical protein
VNTQPKPFGSMWCTWQVCIGWTILCYVKVSTLTTHCTFAHARVCVCVFIMNWDAHRLQVLFASKKWDVHQIFFSFGWNRNYVSHCLFFNLEFSIYKNSVHCVHACTRARVCAHLLHDLSDLQWHKLVYHICFTVLLIFKEYMFVFIWSVYGLIIELERQMSRYCVF